jgi:hypothetical protein
MTWERIQELLSERYSSWPTPAIAMYEIAIVVVAVLVYRYLNARALRVGRHFALIALGAFILEFFTAPMWKNLNLGWWAYVYSDVSWILTVAWATMILCTVYTVDRLLRSAPSWQRYLVYLVVLTPLTLVFDSVNKALGIRVYAPETLASAGPETIPILDVPAAGLYYIPVFMGLIVAFYKYWLPVIEPDGGPSKPVPALGRLALTAVAVFMFEIIVEPMATNQNFPSWSYVYHDITIIMTGFWVILVTVCMLVVDALLPRLDFRMRFAAYLALIVVIATPVEGWFINNGYRVYGPSATADFIGVRTLVGSLPIEVVAAIPLYLALVISFVRYWDGGVTHSLGIQPRSSTSTGAPSAELSAQTAG